MQLPSEYPGDSGSRQGHQGGPAPLLRLRRRAQRLVRRPEELIEHGAGAIDCVLRGEGEAGIGQLLLAVENDRRALAKVPGTVSPEGRGPPPVFVHSLDELHPARELLRHRRRYFIGVLDPCASIEFTRGCPRGLRLLQRLNLLWSELPRAEPGASRRRPRAGQGARSLHRR